MRRNRSAQIRRDDALLGGVQYRVHRAAGEQPHQAARALRFQPYGLCIFAAELLDDRINVAKTVYQAERFGFFPSM
jgi:hypothetical protein